MTVARQSRAFSRVILYTGLASVVLVICIGTPRRHIGQKARIKLCQIEIQNFALAIEAYESSYGTLPAANDANIVDVLRGRNPRGVVFLQAGSRSFDSTGVFIDPWQTPYEIEKATTNSWSIRSAGVNRRFGDADDLASRP